MKLFSVLFWGIFLLASGVIILISHFLRYQVATARLIFGLFVLLVGISLLTTNLGFGNLNISSGNIVAFGSRENIEVKAGNEYWIVFGSADCDTSSLQPGDKAKINSAFGSCTIVLPKGEVKVRATSAFSSIHHPEGSYEFGSRDFGSNAADAVVIDVMCAFGSASLVENR